eukprot:210030-Chlamydomonas_euryale.AAC.3
MHAQLHEIVRVHLLSALRLANGAVAHVDIEQVGARVDPGPVGRAGRVMLPPLGRSLPPQPAFVPRA